MNCQLPIGAEMGPIQLDFALDVPCLSAEELWSLPHARCEHSAETIAPIVARYRAAGRARTLATGVTYLASGADRDVYLLPCGFHVLKLDKGRHAFGDQQSNEVDLWETAEPELRQYLCPLDAWGDGWTVARRADCDGYRYLPDDVETEIAGYGLRDLHPANVGYLGSRPVVLDYGYPVEGRTYLLSSDTVASESSDNGTPETCGSQCEVCHPPADRESSDFDATTRPPSDTYVSDRSYSYY